MNTQALAVPASSRVISSNPVMEAMARSSPSMQPRPSFDSGTWREWDGVLVLDACARVTFCSTAAAELLGRGRDDLLGEQITSVIPELPFGRYTPEFNLAYVFFHGDDGVWKRRRLLTKEGNKVSVDVCMGGAVENVSEVGNRSIVLIIKDPDGSGRRAKRAYVPMNRVFPVSQRVVS